MESFLDRVMKKKIAIEIGSAALRCIAHDTNLGMKDDYDAGYHMGKFYAYFYTLSVEGHTAIEINNEPWKKYSKRLRDSALIYPRRRIRCEGGFMHYSMPLPFFEEVLKDVEKEQGKPLVNEIREGCVICK